MDFDIFPPPTVGHLLLHHHSHRQTHQTNQLSGHQSRVSFPVDLYRNGRFLRLAYLRLFMA